ncbi:MAG: hypothetical protein LBK73_11125 [Treponema sp.]|nr:hypothetical protein [Treponema sp.]
MIGGNAAIAIEFHAENIVQSNVAGIHMGAIAVLAGRLNFSFIFGKYVSKMVGAPSSRRVLTSPVNAADPFSSLPCALPS